MDAATWRRLLSAGDIKAFSDAWLTLLAAQVDLALAPLVGQATVVHQGMVALGAPDSKKYGRTAWFGDGLQVSLMLAKAGERAIQLRHGTVQVGDGPGALCQIAHPILVNGALHGAVALELPIQAKEHLDVAMRLAQWGVAWFAHLLGGNSAQQGNAAFDDTMLRLGVVSTGLAAERLDPAAEAVATLIAERLAVEKISLGVHRRQRTKLLAVSHGGFASIRNAYLTTLIAAMEEAADADAPTGYPVPGGDLAAPHASHAALARSHGADWVRSVVADLPGDQGGSLVVMSEGAGVVPDRLEEQLQTLANDIAPLAALRQQAERGAGTRLTQRAAALLRNHSRWHRAAFAAAPLLLLALALVPVPYRISIDATLETNERRVIAAPFDGYLADATARPGDRMSAGAELARFDDRDLRNQRRDIVERLSQASRELNEAVGLGDRAKASVLAARKAQVEAELALIEDQLKRTVLRAPFDSIVVAGDKTQSIGAPMHQGDALYEIAPAGVFRVALDVPQIDFAMIQPGQTGSLVLSALPYTTWSIRVVRLTPIAIAHNGQTVMRAEAELDTNNDLLRLGMQGIASVDAGRTNLGWLFAHRIVEWLRYQLWAWLP